jgi:hypothetical protein
VLFFRGVQWDPHQIFGRKLRKTRPEQKYLAGDEDDRVEAIEVEVERPGVAAGPAKFKLIPQMIGQVNNLKLRDSYDTDEEADEDEQTASDED